MKRDVSLDEISDGKLYGLNDMVKADCHDCQGCSECCHGMGESVILDPFDVFRLERGLGAAFEQLLAGESLELHVVDGIILPNLKMTGDSEKCTFLDENGRCRIHKFRPGVCRLFPLGRFYENRDFRYFLQIHECPHPSRTKIRVRKWIDTPNLKEYEDFIRKWHYLLSDVESFLNDSGSDALAREWNLYLLKEFYQTPFTDEEHFFGEFACRLEEAGKRLVIKEEPCHADL